MFNLSETTIFSSLFHLKLPLKYRLTKIATNNEHKFGITLIALYHLIIIKIETINPIIPKVSKTILVVFY